MLCVLFGRSLGFPVAEQAEQAEQGLVLLSMSVEGCLGCVFGVSRDTLSSSDQTGEPLFYYEWWVGELLV